LCAQINYGTVNTSKLIKKIYGKSFSELINEYRINYFDIQIKKKLKNKEVFNITDLIKDSGFGTRSLFYVCFMKHKGMSPKEYYRI
jgi:YesN/AraC family two-component response regulator